MEGIKNIVAHVIEGMAVAQSGSFQNIQNIWEQISHDKESRVTDFKEGCLSIEADSSMRLVGLNLKREILLKELQKTFPSVIRIHFKIKARRGL